MLLLSTKKANEQLVKCTKEKRLAMGLTQEGLAKRSGVSLPTLRKYEQKGLISLTSFLKILMVLNSLEDVVAALEPTQVEFSSIDEVLKIKPDKSRKKGWRL